MPSKVWSFCLSFASEFKRLQKMNSQLTSMLKASPHSGHKLQCKANVPTSRRTMKTRALNSQDMSRRASLGMLAAGPAFFMANKGERLQAAASEAAPLSMLQA